MFNIKSSTSLSPASCLLATLLVAAIILTGCDKKDPEPASDNNPAEQNGQLQPDTQTAKDTDAPKTPPPNPVDLNPDKSPAPEPATPKKNLINVIRAARNWGPAQELIHLIGKEAPDFTITDIDGKEHKLSSYRGKNVVLDIWATWCPPCKMTTPHLKELKNTTPQQKLAIMAISRISTNPPNTEQIIKEYAKDKKVNYPVFAVNAGDTGDPYDSARYLPTFFFIDPEGKFKLITAGVMQLQDFTAVLEAEWPEEAPL